ncbi:ABC transporter ATP-binding protein [Psychroflexus aestuariivivens]|uniref:ABC transporter ATP-binding protein n=1 Tax=Psychroflexus aestuariivivens TaxID=1795040 RepID=UPI000FD89A8E|nr:ABC transporter ATP-binding protein [Psychroflexus aestuariivivens]
MNKIKRLIAKHFTNFTYFYRHLRYRIFVAVGLSIAVGTLDGFGLSMFLPLLQMVNDSSNVDTDGMGKLRFLVDFIEDSGIELTLVSVLAFMFFFFLLKGIAKYVSGRYNISIQQFFVRKLRLKILTGLSTLSFKKFITSDSGRIQNTMTGEVERLAKSFSSYFSAIQQGVIVSVYIVFTFFIDFQFAILVVIGGFLTNFIYRIVYIKTKSASKELTTQNHEYQGLVLQQVGNFKYLRSTGTEELYEKKLRNSVYQIEGSRKKIGFLNAFLLSVKEPMMVGVVALVIILQTKFLGGTLGPILISLLFFYRALAILLVMQSQWNAYLSVSGSMENMKEFQGELEENKETQGDQQIVFFEKALSLNNVSFNYGEERILYDINLNIKKDETVAFVGESGSGKTTLINLLAGLMPVDGGEFTVDGIERNDLDVHSYQRRIGYITQEPVVFNDTILNNVTFWSEPNPNTLRQFKKACKQAAIWDFIQTLPNREDTELGNNGINLSGGQKQRISIARELYKDIDILIMDEATSALDSETEKSIKKNIENLKGQYTILVVAHRLSTIKNADRVVFMENGQIKDIGRYEELVDRAPKFKKMVELQEV